MLEWPDNGRQYELYDGEVIVVPAPFPGHPRVTANVADLLREYAKTTGGLALSAPLNIVLSEHNVVQPDVVFFSPERRQLVKDWEVTRSAPDLAVECCRNRRSRATVVERWICSHGSVWQSTGSSIPS